MADRLSITRDDPGGIPLDEWLQYIAASAVVRPVPPRDGVNPFTKQPTVFRPPAGAAVFRTVGGDCFIEYRDGELLLSGATEHATAVASEIARAMRARVNVVE
jgi:hypothetical protein